MAKLKIFFLMMFFAHSAISKLQVYTPRLPFRFAQQIFWDSRTNIALFTDSSAAPNDPSIYKFEWKTRRLQEYTVRKSPSTDASFCVPAASSSELLLCGFTNCVSYVSLTNFPREAIRRKDVACRVASALGQIDRGATLSDGALVVSLIPKNYCDTSAPHPKASVAYVDLKMNNLVDALSPGFYSNGFSYDPTTNTMFMADDCLPALKAYNYHENKKSLSKPLFKQRGNSYLRFMEFFAFSKVVYRFLAAKNFPSGLALDKCGNLYVGELNTGKVYYIDTKTGKLLNTINVPGTHVTDVGIIGPQLDHLAVITGVGYHDTYGNNKCNSTDPGDGKLYVIPLDNKRCKGRPGTPVAGV